MLLANESQIAIECPDGVVSSGLCGRGEGARVVVAYDLATAQALPDFAMENLQDESFMHRVLMIMANRISGFKKKKAMCWGESISMCAEILHCLGIRPLCTNVRCLIAWVTVMNDGVHRLRHGHCPVEVHGWLLRVMTADPSL